MNIIYIGAFPPSSIINSDGSVPDSFYRSEQPLVDALSKSENITFNVITSPDIPSFPKGNFYIQRAYDKNEKVFLVSSLNVPIIKHIWTFLSMTRAASKIISKTKEVVYVIIPYMVIRHVAVSRFLKKLYGSRVRVCSVIPDIFYPKSIVQKLINKWTERHNSFNDCFILYTQFMASYLKIENKPYLVYEGFRRFDPCFINQNHKEGSFTITYAGSLLVEYGVLRLLDSMSLIKNNSVKLNLYGKGNAVEYIKEYALIDSRIQYKGCIPNKEVMSVLCESSVLINPRSSSDGSFTDYSFPSKDIEYLSSGVPCVFCKLPGMPVEYYDFFVDCGMGSPEEIASSINRVFNMSYEERIKFGFNARSFITKRLDICKQTNEIIQFLNLVQ